MSIGILIAGYDMFDVLDLDVLRRIGTSHDYVIAAVLDDEEVLALTGKPPVVPFWERQDIVAAVKGVSGVIPANPEMIAVCRPDAIYSVSQDLPDWVKVARGAGSGAVHVTLTSASAEDELAAVRPVVGQTGYVPGAWDMFHIGHLNILKRAREMCDRLIVGVVTDEALFAMKAKHPMVTLEERVAIVNSMGVVDEVVVDFSPNKREVWDRVRFDILFKGDDWKDTPQGKQLEADMAEVGVEVRYFPYTTHTSSTKLRRVVESR